MHIGNNWIFAFRKARQESGCESWIQISTAPMISTSKVCLCEIQFTQWLRDLWLSYFVVGTRKKLHGLRHLLEPLITCGRSSLQPTGRCTRLPRKPLHSFVTSLRCYRNTTAMKS